LKLHLFSNNDKQNFIKFCFDQYQTS